MRETIEFNGNKYHRYPNARQSSHRKYYTFHDNWKKSPRLLHRDIWEFHNGPIPEGHHIHHSDGNHNNNEISNLVCLSSAAHQVEHREERSKRAKSPKHLEHLDNIRGLTKSWHASEAGRLWHREHALRTITKDRPEIQCIECGISFKPKVAKSKICGKLCKEQGQIGSKEIEPPDYLHKEQPVYDLMIDEQHEFLLMAYWCIIV